LAVASVSNAGLLPEFSNSFLFIAGRNLSPTWQHVLNGPIEHGELAWCYANNRRIPTTTVFSLPRGRSEIHVKKHAMRREHEQTTVAEGPAISVQWNGLAESALSDGVESPLAMVRRAYFDGADAWYKLLVDFLKWSIDRWQLSDARWAGLDG